jgi:hypothetical protein
MLCNGYSNERLLLEHVPDFLVRCDELLKVLAAEWSGLLPADAATTADAADAADAGPPQVHRNFRQPPGGRVRCLGGFLRLDQRHRVDWN